MADQTQRTRGFSVGRVLGARVIIQPATLVMLVILAFLLSPTGAGLTRASFTIGLILALALIASVFLHEVAHAMAARLFKREVHEIVLTLWGGHTSFDSRNLTPVVNGVVSIAGPAANVVIAGIVAIVTQVAQPTGLTHSVMWWIVWANLLLAAFNALPGIPMDGGRVLEAIVWGVTKDRNRGLVVAAWAGRVVAVGVLVASIGLPYLRGSTPSMYTVVWGFVIFSVLWPAASAALKAGTALARVERVGAASVMVPAVSLEYTATVEQAQELAERHGALEVIVLAADGVPAGHFPVTMIDAVPAVERSRTYLQSVTMPIPRGALMESSLMGTEFVHYLQEWWGKTDVWAVVDDGRVVGAIRAADALNALN